MSEHPTRFTQISCIREEDGDTIYALDDAGTVWSYWTGRSSDKKWRQVPSERMPEP